MSFTTTAQPASGPDGIYASANRASIPSDEVVAATTHVSKHLSNGDLDVGLVLLVRLRDVAGVILFWG